MEKKHVIHTFDPVYDRMSEVLILGSFPSVKSREGQFYYHHPQNRFWKVMSVLLQEALPETIAEKKEMLLHRNIAIWDVIYSCDIKGSSDSSIQNVVPNPINQILTEASIRGIYCNGSTAYQLYQKYCKPETGRTAVKLPSTSPANAIWTLDRLLDSWKQVVL